jgi:hypothetical protein
VSHREAGGGDKRKELRVSHREAGGGNKRKELRVSHREAGGGEYKRKELRVSHKGGRSQRLVELAENDQFIFKSQKIPCAGRKFIYETVLKRYYFKC